MGQPSYQAYVKTQKIGGNPQETLARALIESVKRMNVIRQPPVRRQLFDQTLVLNLKLWGTLATDISDANNPLPDEVKVNLLNLFAFVDKHTSALLQNRLPHKVDILISINRNIAQGLTQATGGIREEDVPDPEPLPDAKDPASQESGAV
ncbi:MAG: flagellar biosynthesis regulator FlaF [Alphaproteobacteria bacterium]|nr:flagellar biosynthesis regulator FlaF [Alphaproteobacteria bacterium]